MNELTTTCPHCNAAVQYPPAYAGRNLKCYACDSEFTAPTAPLTSDELSSEWKRKAQENTRAKIESETTEIKDKKGASYSLRINEDEPIFHRFCRRGGWIAVGLGILSFFGYLYYSGSEMEAEASDALGLFTDLIWVVLVLFGSAQLIRFFHSIAFNTQEMRKEMRKEK